MFFLNAYNKFYSLECKESAFLEFSSWSQLCLVFTSSPSRRQSVLASVMDLQGGQDWFKHALA